ncbi:hypothetical protein EGW08_014478 [Elysia chlorotica]|uniref:Uncharacterized protein n=1 Tax=Elysia chlorotica TaxID=188477 RepID=A0A3S0ZLN3_ELYCH|nr:hypothetical protein EGW08_014478 [Elysia chlorotica]
MNLSPGVVAGSCNPATWRLELVDGLRPGVLLPRGPRRSGVRAKLAINMVVLGEPGAARLSKEGRTGPGGKPSRQKSPCLVSNKSDLGSRRDLHFDENADEQ